MEWTLWFHHGRFQLENHLYMGSIPANRDWWDRRAIHCNEKQNLYGLQCISSIISWHQLGELLLVSLIDSGCWKQDRWSDGQTIQSCLIIFALIWQSWGLRYQNSWAHPIAFEVASAMDRRTLKVIAHFRPTAAMGLACGDVWGTTWSIPSGINGVTADGD